MGSSSVLKISSRSTAVVVLSCLIVPPSGISASFWPGEAEVDVAVGDAGEGGLADGGERALAQRRVLSSMLRVSSAWPSGVRRMSSTLPAGMPETCTRLPLTSCEAFWKRALTW